MSEEKKEGIIGKIGYRTVNPGTGGTGQPLNIDKIVDGMKHGEEDAAKMRKDMGLKPLPKHGRTFDAEAQASHQPAVGDDAETKARKVNTPSEEGLAPEEPTEKKSEAKK